MWYHTILFNNKTSIEKKYIFLNNILIFNNI